MARIRFEIWYDDDHFDSVEVGNSDLHESFERAVRMAQAALPPKEPEPPLEPGTYSMVLKDVQFNDDTQTLLFGQVASDVRAGKFQVRLSGAQRKPCGQTCHARGSGGEDDSCSDTCAKPEGHDGWHETADKACTWDPSLPPQGVPW